MIGEKRTSGSAIIFASPKLGQNFDLCWHVSLPFMGAFGPTSGSRSRRTWIAIGCKRQHNDDFSCHFSSPVRKSSPCSLRNQGRKRRAAAFGRAARIVGEHNMSRPKAVCSGAGEGNRTLVISLEDSCRGPTGPRFSQHKAVAIACLLGNCLAQCVNNSS